MRNLAYLGPLQGCNEGVNQGQFLSEGSTGEGSTAKLLWSVAGFRSLNNIKLMASVSCWLSVGGGTHFLPGCCLEIVLSSLPHEFPQHGYLVHQSQPRKESPSKMHVTVLCNIITEVIFAIFC